MSEATGAAPLWDCGCVMGDPGCTCGLPVAPTSACAYCGHDAEHGESSLGGGCVWLDNWQRDGKWVQSRCGCLYGLPSAVLVARCGDFNEMTEAICPGELRFTWGMSQTVCDTCGGWCGVTVAHWVRVESPDA